MKRFLLALQFLTIFPIKIKGKLSIRDYGRSLVYFPVVGLIIGIILSIIAGVFSFLPASVTALIIVLASTLVTGAIHLDGFSDTCDGLYGSRPREEILNIMRDSRTGVMGATGLIILLLLKFALLGNIPSHNLWKAIIMAAVLARYSQVMACFLSKYARKQGKAQYFIEHANRQGVIIGALFTYAVFFLLAGFKGLLIFIIGLLFILLSIKYIKKRIGGMTGDTVGAISEFTEASTLFLALIWLI